MRKPLVLVRSGRAAALLPAGHRVDQVRLSAEAEDALFAQAGIVRVGTLSAAMDVGAVLAHQPLPRGNRVAIVGNSFAVGLLAMDACVAHGLSVAGGRPLDLGAHADASAYDAALTAAVGDDDVDAVVVVFVPPLVGDDPDVRAAVARHAEGQSGKPVVSTFLAHTGMSLQLGAVPSYDSPETAVAALAGAVAYAAWRQRPIGALPELADIDIDAAREIAAAAVAAGSPTLTDDQTAALLEAVGIRLWPGVRAQSVSGALRAARGLGWPVALKAADERLRRRFDLCGVRLCIGSERDLRAAYDAVSILAAGEVVLQSMALPAVAVSVCSV